MIGQEVKLIMKHYLFLSILTLALFVGSCSSQSKKDGLMQNEELQLSLRFGNDTYHVGEPIIAIVTLENIGNGDTIVNSRMAVNLPFESSPLREIAFTVTTPSGKDYWPAVQIDNVGIRSQLFVALKPGTTIEKKINLDSFRYEFTEVGTYKVIANYQNFVDPNYANPDDTRIAWKGELNSNEVLLTIIP